MTLEAVKDEKRQPGRGDDDRAVGTAAGVTGSAGHLIFFSFLPLHPGQPRPHP